MLLDIMHVYLYNYTTEDASVLTCSILNYKVRTHKNRSTMPYDQFPFLLNQNCTHLSGDIISSKGTFSFLNHVHFILIINFLF
jgi:hypothetical protein